MTSQALNNAKAKKDDEFYTLYEDIENEMSHYDFTDKVIYCNTDHYEKSNFVKYFSDHFDKLGIKGLIATCYNKDGRGILYRKNKFGEYHAPLVCNGDFRNPDCISLMDEADIVITNPPFSLLRAMYSIIKENNKKFILIAPVHSMNYSYIYPDVIEGTATLGSYNRINAFMRPDGSIKSAAALWVTNIDIGISPPIMELTAEYYGNEDYYPFYYEYDIINIDRTSDIPRDYEYEMGVPVSAILKISLDQFDIRGVINPFIGGKSEHANSRHVFQRLVIVNKTLPGYKPQNTLNEYIK